MFKHTPSFHTFNLSSLLFISACWLPHSAHASEQFTLNAQMTNAALTGTFQVDIDSTPVSNNTVNTYELIDWDLQLTQSGGDTIYFSPGEPQDSAILQLFFGYETIQGFDRLNLTFIEDSSALNGESINLQIEFNTDYNITSETTLSLLLEEDPLVGSAESFRSSLLKLSSNTPPQYLRSASFEVNNDSTPEAVSPVPEPSTLAMLGLGSLMLWGATRRAKKSHPKITV